MWLLRSVQNGFRNRQEPEFAEIRQKAFSLLVFTVLFNVFLGLLLLLGDDLLGALILFIPSGTILSLLMMMQSGRVQQEDIENAASPYLDYTIEMKNSFEHLSDIIRQNETGYSS